MNGRPSAVLGLIVALALLPVGRAAPPTTAQTEITYLLGFGANSGCEFFRNGSWYDGKKAEAHLRYKYESWKRGTESIRPKTLLIRPLREAG